ncbi:unnamed protein product [Acanthoscelides obtectus]|uniref:Uncharacterized protein n=1 Tax=Acanthoscelides obtectus TaxID=200917 RepID=A0A9P0PR14_ACAOB|nr:unnamed protein product [Acanthoscelides obtectus]CAK1646869.1 hypothetical protein AOBTE_LOCUS14903 [Acanthoscelides obtectus]
MFTLWKTVWKEGPSEETF